MKHVTLSPVFIEPTFKHRLINSFNKHVYILVFEVIVAIILINFFFKEEIMNYLSKFFIKPPKNSLYFLIQNKKLICDNDYLMVSTPKGNYSAFSLRGKPIKINDCSSLLLSINGTPISSYSVFGGR